MTQEGDGQWRLLLPEIQTRWPKRRANPHLQICRYLPPTVGWQSWFCEMRSTSESLSPKLFGDSVTIRKQTVDRISLSPNHNSKKGKGVGFGVICFLSIILCWGQVSALGFQSLIEPKENPLQSSTWSFLKLQFIPSYFKQVLRLTWSLSSL